MLHWIRNLLLVLVAIVVVTLIGAVPLFTLYLSFREFGSLGVAVWYLLVVALAFVVEVRVLRHPTDSGPRRLILGCLIAPVVVLAAGAVACLPLYLARDD